MMPEAAEQSGTICEHTPQGNRFVIALDDARTIEAMLPRTVMRRTGCLLGSLVGWRVKVRFCEPPKPHRIVELRLP